MMGAEPSPEAIEAFATENPDKWAQTVRLFAQLAGYKDGVEHSGHISMSVGQMSDAQMEIELQNIRQELLALEKKEGDAPLD